MEYIPLTSFPCLGNSDDQLGRIKILEQAMNTQAIHHPLRVSELITGFPKRFVGVLALCILAMVYVACSSEEPTPTRVPATATPVPAPTATAPPEPEVGTIVDVAVGNGSFTTLLAAVEAAGLADTLAGAGPFTVFAPTDDAFAQLPEGTVEGLLGDVDALTSVLLYHVVSGDVKAADVVTLESAETLQGQSVAIAVDGGNVMIDDANVVIADVEASNGTIHVIDAVLIPSDPEPEVGTIVDVAVGNGSFTTLLAAVEAAGLADTLAGDGPFTVFAPTDEAFSNLPGGTVEGLLGDVDALTSVLLYHVVSGDVKAADVVTLESAETLQGQSVAIAVDGGNVMIDDANVVIADVEASNGTIHVIDAVLIPSDPEPEVGTIVDVAVGNGSFTTLLAAVEAAGLAETLSGAGPFTVFAPTDDAFSNLPEGTVEGLLGDVEALTSVLLYHVVAGDVKASDVVTLESAETLQGQSVAIAVDGGNVMIDAATVVIADVEASNGTIHVIDAVLIPSGP